MGHDHERLLVDVDDIGVATVTLNRPDAKNAIDHTMDAEIQDVMWALDVDPSVRAIVLTGAGDTFSVGIDMAAGPKVFDADAHAAHDAALGVDSDSIAERYAWWTMRTPTIGAINGHAIGAGFTLTLLLDIRIVADDAKLRLPFVHLGVAPDANSTWLLPRLVGLERSLELTLTGRTVLGAEAPGLGLALESAPASDVLARAQELGRTIAARSAPLAVGVTKQLVYEGLGEDDRLAAFQRETRLIWWLGTRPDATEGVMAMLERRGATWQDDKGTALPEEGHR